MRAKAHGSSTLPRGTLTVFRHYDNISALLSIENRGLLIMPTSRQIDSQRLWVWKLMEFAGILNGKKRRTLMEELLGKERSGALEADERKILAAERNHPNDKRTRMKYLRNRLKEWEKTVAYYAS